MVRGSNNNVLCCLLWLEHHLMTADYSGSNISILLCYCVNCNFFVSKSLLSNLFYVPALSARTVLLSSR